MMAAWKSKRALFGGALVTGLVALTAATPVHAGKEKLGPCIEYAEDEGDHEFDAYYQPRRSTARSRSSRTSSSRRASSASPTAAARSTRCAPATATA